MDTNTSTLTAIIASLRVLILQLGRLGHSRELLYKRWLHAQLHFSKTKEDPDNMNSIRSEIDSFELEITQMKEIILSILVISGIIQKEWIAEGVLNREKDKSTWKL